ncbi:MAG: DUF4331 family protein [Ferruginibacter sp.]
MKNIKLFCALLIGGVVTFSACKDKGGNEPGATVYYQQADGFGRPAINTVFNNTADKDAFNTTAIPAMSAGFSAKFKAKLLALNPGYTTNLLGLDATTFSGVLATDVLTVTLSNTTPTTFFDGTNVLTGRNLSDDVIDVELTLIFGGPMGTANAGLTSDHVNANDKAFLTTFPYEATPW